jgi:hypothetical protein
MRDVYKPVITYDGRYCISGYGRLVVFEDRATASAVARLMDIARYEGRESL